MYNEERLVVKFSIFVEHVTSMQLSIRYNGDKNQQLIWSLIFSYHDLDADYKIYIASQL